jgi:hypothetical protein
MPRRHHATTGSQPARSRAGACRRCSRWAVSHVTFHITGEPLSATPGLTFTNANQQNAGWLEIHSFPIDTYARRPLVLQDGFAIAPITADIGVESNWEKLGPYLDRR